jgi:3-phenylpropionate/trans-cinnamate dioxygenase ferredoxin subunit
MTKHVVGSVEEIQPGGSKLVEIRGREIGIFNVAGSFYALANRCPHGGGALCKGIITGLALSDRPGSYRLERKGEFLRCPWHGWEFEISTGQSYCDPKSVRVRQFNVSVEVGESLAKGPYVAESFPVSIDESYIVIDL